MDRQSPVLGGVIYRKLLVMGLCLQGSVNYHRESVQPLVSVQLPLENCREDVSIFVFPLSGELVMKSNVLALHCSYCHTVVPPAHPHYPGGFV